MILETLQISLRFSTQTQITNSCFCLTGAFYNLILCMASKVIVNLNDSPKSTGDKLEFSSKVIEV